MNPISPLIAPKTIRSVLLQALSSMYVGRTILGSNGKSKLDVLDVALVDEYDGLDVHFNGLNLCGRPTTWRRTMDQPLPRIAPVESISAIREDPIAPSAVVALATIP